jgi:hypothetical protein
MTLGLQTLDAIAGCMAAVVRWLGPSQLLKVEGRLVVALDVEAPSAQILEQAWIKAIGFGNLTP